MYLMRIRRRSALGSSLDLLVVPSTSQSSCQKALY